jgi:hypothetical protein
MPPSDDEDLSSYRNSSGTTLAGSGLTKPVNFLAHFFSAQLGKGIPTFTPHFSRGGQKAGGCGPETPRACSSAPYRGPPLLVLLENNLAVTWHLAVGGAVFLGRRSTTRRAHTGAHPAVLGFRCAWPHCRVSEYVPCQLLSSGRAKSRKALPTPPGPPPPAHGPAIDKCCAGGRLIGRVRSRVSWLRCVPTDELSYYRGGRPRNGRTGAIK